MNLEFNDYIDYISNMSNIVGIDIDYHPYLKYTKKYINKYKKYNLIYKNITRKLLNLLCNLFEWEVPKEINKRVLELSFIFSGGITLYKNISKGIICLPSKSMNRLNIYGEPMQTRVFGFNGFNDIVDIINDIELIGNDYLLKLENPKNNIGIYGRDNKMAYAPIHYVIETASKISDTKRAIDVLKQRLKSPFIFNCSKENEINVKRALDGIFENDDLIISNSNALSKVENIQNANNLDRNLIALKENLLFDYNNFLETFGINSNPNPDKKERLVVDEVNSNNDTLEIFSKSRLNERLEFCKRAKEILNIDINVKPNYNILANNDGGDNEKNKNTKNTYKKSNK